MPVSAQADSIPLPKGWPNRVRSGVIHVISLAHVALTFARSVAANSINARIRLKVENNRLRQEIALLIEEARIKDSRMDRIPAQRRPHFPPIERMAILELRAARGWSLSQAARRFLIAPATIASWTQRLDEEGPSALVQVREAVNKFPVFVRYIVQRLKLLCPSMGKVKIAEVLGRAGLHLSVTTVERMLRERPRRRPVSALQAGNRRLRSKRPNHILHVDLTAIPIVSGLWAPWLPFALPQRWPFCWWLALAVDHYSRRIMGFAVFSQPPESKAVTAFLGRVMQDSGVTPRYLITDQGRQFTSSAFRRWCRYRGIRQRFGAVDKHGSLSVVERCIRTLKDECTRRVLVSYRQTEIRTELALFVTWYDQHRPNTGLDRRTPDEVYYGLAPACLAPRYEPRRKWPRRSPCAAPQTKIRGCRGIRLELHVQRLAGRNHLPIVELKRAA